MPHWEDGTIAGSATNLYDCMRNAISFGIAPEQAVLSRQPDSRKELGCAGELGSIEEGKLADFIVCTEDFSRRAVYMGGEQL